MPSSILYKEHHTREQAKAKIKYWVKAIVHADKSSETMKYKQVLMIREKPVPFKEGERKGEMAKIKTWCCID